jgi:hypothetical protein
VGGWRDPARCAGLAWFAPLGRKKNPSSCLRVSAAVADDRNIFPARPQSRARGAELAENQASVRQIVCSSLLFCPPTTGSPLAFYLSLPPPRGPAWAALTGLGGVGGWRDPARCAGLAWFAPLGRIQTPHAGFFSAPLRPRPANAGSARVPRSRDFCE